MCPSCRRREKAYEYCADWFPWTLRRHECSQCGNVVEDEEWKEKKVGQWKPCNDKIARSWIVNDEYRKE